MPPVPVLVVAMAVTGADELADLLYHWDEVYVIWRAAGRWFALPKLPPVGDPLEAWTAQGLRVKIRADYKGRQNK